uniref:uncharacterized protein LOC122594896 n=1 Tax=Erigeron canadensis TaxID=72917 RepID=UPI001CB9B2DF|nr:uncharacterized protein LOC122594896 [Erigeron canadensis]
MVRTVKARVMYTDPDGNKVELEPSSITMYFDAESAPTDGDDEEEVGSVSKRPAEDSTMVGGSVLKRPRVDLGEASQVLVGNLNPGQDSSATGTIEEVKSGSVINKDLGGSSEIV